MTLPANAKEQVEKLMNDLMPFAEKMIREHGEFYPFAALTNHNGKTEMVAQTEGDRPEPSEVLDSLTVALRKAARNGQCTATCRVVHVALDNPEKGERVDAVQFLLDHAEGYSVEVFAPYRKEDKKLKFETPFIQPGAAYIFS
jgi:hypothetical protein